MSMDWNYIDNVIIDDDTKQIHCDTRDFHCMLLTDKFTLKGNPQITRNMHKTKFRIKRDEIIDFLKHLETISGGKSNWRMLSFKTHISWLKYIRIYHIQNDTFVVCNRDNKPIEWRTLTEENIQGQYLATQN